MRFYESLWKLTKATIFHSIFFVKSLTFIPYRSIAMHYWNFVILHREKQFFCLLLYHFVFRWHWQIFRHRQMKGNSPNIADTYVECDNRPSHIIIITMRCLYYFQKRRWKIQSSREGRACFNSIPCQCFIVLYLTELRKFQV